mmetsp:Transcript_25687/g.25914  ORF Transcript_25687/g.25914 Transcript_25687/m.25914 type:complete len:111 (-) Transcript_25687:81-413(-)
MVRAQFASLFLSSAIVMKQVAFMLVVAVLIDAFVVRILLVPIWMSLLADAAWWPRRFVSHGRLEFNIVQRPSQSDLSHCEDISNDILRQKSFVDNGDSARDTGHYSVLSG